MKVFVSARACEKDKKRSKTIINVIVFFIIYSRIYKIRRSS
jgi:hypothetical protein